MKTSISKKNILYLLITLFFLSSTYSSFASYNEAPSSKKYFPREANTVMENRKWNRKGVTEAHPFAYNYESVKKNISQSVRSTTNGIVITYTTNDSNTLRFLQGWFNFSSLYGSYPNISVSQVNISYGVQVTIISSDWDLISKLQQISTDSLPKIQAGFTSYFSSFSHSLNTWKSTTKSYGNYEANIVKNVYSIHDGVSFTFTSSDTTTINYLQDTFRFSTVFWRDSDLSISQTNTSNGVQITVTSSDGDIVSRLQSLSRSQIDSLKKTGLWTYINDRNNYDYDATITKNYSVNSNGGIITYTTIDPITLDFIQSSFDFSRLFPSLSWKATITQTNISNGVQVILYSSDSNTITKIWNTISLTTQSIDDVLSWL